MPTIDELAASVATLVPPGTVAAYAGEVDDNNGQKQGEIEAVPGWLLCNGAAVSSRTFPKLFRAIQASHGNGQDNAGNAKPIPAPDFNLPDYRGYFLRGVTGATSRDPNGSDTDRPHNHLGGNIGNRVGSIQDDTFKSHSHVWETNTAERFGGKNPSSVQGGSGGQQFPYPTTENPGGSETRPKNAYVHWIIRHGN